MTYIAIEGVIGVGKTTLARLLQPELSAQIVLEVFEENPFLSRFYEDRARYAFQTQIFFLLSRYQQQRSLAMAARPLVSDYIFAKDALFARLNLAGDELAMYERVHEALAEQIEMPDLIVFLRADTDTLMQRIALRDRPYERAMERDYIDSLRRAYEAYFATYTASPVLTIDSSQLDYVANDADRRQVVTRILGQLGHAPHQEALPGFGAAGTAEVEAATAPPLPGPPPDLANGARRLADFQRFHEWLDAAKDFEQDPYFNFILLQEEIGELARLLTRRWRADRRGDREPPQLGEVAGEMADTLAYLLKLANYLGIDLEAAYLEKMRANQTRSWK
ncbi:MAG: deoxynucleoside kinase [Anaerolineae bacterium]|nr:deoxynucleoside kinase [Anaerolineae bacterium]